MFAILPLTIANLSLARSMLKFMFAIVSGEIANLFAISPLTIRIFNFSMDSLKLMFAIVSSEIANMFAIPRLTIAHLSFRLVKYRIQEISIQNPFNLGLVLIPK